ncbi:MAG: ribosome small subunit-dependent GTPase A [Oscillospiraceae bacterium]|nr:ribosome small subunit-dependent GTPase A [Oscillospiraceae bacterium]
MNGIIIKGIGGFYYVKTADDNIYECKARGIFRKEHIMPMIGDRVSIDISGGKGSITEISPRTTQLVRPPVANIDTLVLVVAAASPDPNLFLLDKMLVNAEINGIEPMICINKTDLVQRADLEEIYKCYTVIYVSAEKREGIDKLSSLIKDRVSAFAGLSGVGKSSLLNLITDSEMETGSVSKKINRGRHTTRHVELMELSTGGFVLDTPGFSSLEIDSIKADELQNYFPEMAEVKNDCRFRGCSHINEPDCAVKRLLNSKGIAQSRYESYKELYNTLKQIKEWEKK